MNRSLLLKAFNLFLLWPTLLFSQINSGTFVVRPKEIDDVLNNPGIGFTTFQRFNGDTLTTLNNKSGMDRRTSDCLSAIHRRFDQQATSPNLYCLLEGLLEIS